ncbi:MAG: sulfatase [Acidobacteriota bacterium]
MRSIDTRTAALWVTAGALAVLAAACARTGSSGQAAAKAPNVLLLTIDTLRLERVTCYGGPAGNTPAIDALAGGGVRFERVQATRGLTWPSLTSLLTGLYPRTHEVRLNGHQLDERFATLPEILQAAGYETGGFLSNMCDAPNRGLDTFFCAWWEKTGRPDRPERRQWASHDQPAWDRSITTQAEAFLRRPHPKPFFAWVHYIDPHKPYDPVADFVRDEYDGSFLPDTEVLDRRTLDGKPLTAAEKIQLLAAYDSQVSGVDAHIGRLLSVLDSMHLAGDTLVILAADHGEELGDHNTYMYHSASVYQQVLSIPWILRWPGHLPAGRVIGADVASVDIAPTILSLLDLDSPDAMEGRSRVALIRAEPGAGGAERTFAEWQAQILVVGEGPYRFVWNPLGVETHGLPFRKHDGHGFVIPEVALYDLRDDPLEQFNVLDARPGVAARLKDAACRFITEKPFATPASSRIPRDVKARLRALGYVQDTPAPEEEEGIDQFCETER